MSTNTAPLGSRVDSELRIRFDEPPRDVRKPAPDAEAFAADMDMRFRRMLDGNEAEHDLVEA